MSKTRIAGATFVLLVAATVGVMLGRTLFPPPAPTVVPDTVRMVPEELLARIAELEEEKSGIRARLEGWETRGPEVVRVTEIDTLFLPSPVMFRGIQVVEGGLMVGRYEEADTAPGLYRASILEGMDVRDCDEGWRLLPSGEVQCNRARLGHLELFGGIGLAADPVALPSPSLGPSLGAGLRWTRCFRCTETIELAGGLWGGEARAWLWASKGLRIF